MPRIYTAANAMKKACIKIKIGNIFKYLIYNYNVKAYVEKM